MKICFYPIILFLLVSGCVRPQYAMEVTDLNGSKKSYFANDEAVKLDIQWVSGDSGKTITCSIANAYDGNMVWRGVATLPETKPHQKYATIQWNPPFPNEGIKMKRGNYTANCNFNDEVTITKAVSVTNVKTWP